MKSYGIMLLGCDERAQTTVLIAQKRNTYGYIDFINVRYNKNDNKRLQSLFDNMTIHEKLDILSLDFDRLMYKYNLININADDKQIFSEGCELYKKKKFVEWKRKFEQNFCNTAGRKRLKTLINSSSSIESMWDIPRGRKVNIREKDLNCAIREFYEETHIGPENYNILTDEQCVITQIDDGIEYIFYYYVAVCNVPNLQPKININNYLQISEVIDLKFEVLGKLCMYNLYSAEKIQDYLRRINKQYRLHVYSKSLLANKTF